MDQSTIMQEFGFETPDLSGAETISELSPLEFDTDGYADYGAVAAALANLPRKPGKKPSTKSLSVNGTVVQDRMDKYLAAKGESSSALKEALKSPRHYLIYTNGDLKPADESHFTLGTFIHSAFLEPSKFNKVKVLPEGCNRASKSGITALIQYYWELLHIAPDVLISEMKMDDLKEVLFDLETEAKNAGYTFIDPTMEKVVNVVRFSYMTYAGGILPRLVANGRTETSFYGRDEATGLKVKIRPDCLLLEENVGFNMVLSVKTTSATSLEGFMRDAAKYRYELAEGMYLQVASEITGRKFTGTLMLIAQTVIPYQCALLWLDAEDLECGRYKNRQALDVVKHAKETNSWPGFEAFAEDKATGMIHVRFPEWIKGELKPQNINQ